MSRRVLALLWLLCGAASAQDYVRTQVPNKPLCLSWGVREYVYTYHSTGSARTPGTTEFTAMDQAFATWATLAKQCTDFKYTKATPVAEALVGYKQGSMDNTNVLTFRETNCRDVAPGADSCFADESCGNKYQCWDHADETIGLTTTTFSFKTGTIFDADIELNGSPHRGGAEGYLFTTVGSPPCEPGRQSTACVATDVQNTLTHELGHAMGLDHVGVPTSTMAPNADIGETNKRVIDSGSAQGFCDTYPVGLPSSPCDGTLKVSHRIVAVSKGTGASSGFDLGLGCSSSAGASASVLSASLLLWCLRRSRRTERSPFR
ncbi:MAG: myxosortase-dependent metalloprotease, MXAN_2677/MXAN_2678 family [Myxococcaceae bacterium]